MRHPAASDANWKLSSAVSSNSTLNLGNGRGSGKISMSAPEFLDSNILVYAHDDTDEKKKAIAQDFLRRAVLGEFIASTQTLAEFATTLLHKFSPLFSPADVLAILDSLSPIKLVAPRRGSSSPRGRSTENYGLHFYDGMIVVAAERGGCSRIWSEDMNAGQKYFGIIVANPFQE